MAEVEEQSLSAEFLDGNIYKFGQTHNKTSKNARLLKFGQIRSQVFVKMKQIPNNTNCDFRLQNVSPDPTTTCGPYSLRGQKQNSNDEDDKFFVDENDVKFGNAGNHDTIGMIAIDAGKFFPLHWSQKCQ